MARYIDADAFKELITEQGNIQNNKGAAYWLCVLIDEQPTANVAPIADTVQKVLHLVKERAESCEIIIASSIRPIDAIYQISNTELEKIEKEMLEGEK